MKREIKFRGKRVDNVAWVEGYYTKIPSPNIMFINNDSVIDCEEVIPETVGQFTGLKDKNGKYIYEGDKIDHYALFGYVVYENGMFSISSNANTQFCNCKQPLAFHDVNEMKVIGNIHDNPQQP